MSKQPRYTVLNPDVGYESYKKDRLKYYGFDIEEAGFFDKETAQALVDNLDGKAIVTEYTEEQLEDFPFDPPLAQTKEVYGLSAKDTPRAFVSEDQKNVTRFALVDPSYGYLNEDAEFIGFDLTEGAALYTEEDMDRLNIDKDQFIKQPLTDEAVQALPVEVPYAKGLEQEATSSLPNDIKPKTPEFDFGSFGEGLDDLDQESSLTKE